MTPTIPPIKDIAWSDQTSIEHEGLWYNVFQMDSFAAKVTFHDDTIMVFVFPIAWQSRHEMGDEASTGKITEAIEAKFRAGWNKVVIL